MSPRRPEHNLERGQVAPFYGGLSIDVYPTSTRVKPVGVRPGIADLVCFFDRIGFQFFHETKVPPRRQTEAQWQFEQSCIACGVPYVLGGIEEAMEFVAWLGLGVRINDTICIYPRDRWPTKEDPMPLAWWHCSDAHADARAKYGYRRAA